MSIDVYDLAGSDRTDQASHIHAERDYARLQATPVRRRRRGLMRLVGVALTGVMCASALTALLFYRDRAEDQARASLAFEQLTIRLPPSVSARARPSSSAL